jgi:DNA segregation ATPase FtsK/SpoIIIE, S-DNA-T family
MATNNPHGDPRPGDGRDPIDWDRYETEVADVVDLDAARAHRSTDLDDQDDTVPVLVDSPAAQRAPRLTAAGLRAAQRRPIRPPWLRSWAELRDAARWTVGHLSHSGLYHLTRTPKYAGRLAWRAPRGAGKAISGYGRWLFDLQGEQLRQATADQNNAELYLKVAKLRDQRVRWRGFITTALLVVLAPALVLGWLAAPHPARILTLAALVTILGGYGRPPDKPLLDTAVVVPRVARLTSDVVVRALSVLGLAGINQAIARNGTRAINFPAPIVRDGPGWRADVDLPYGVTAGEVLDRRDKLASGLGRPLGCVWPEGHPDVSPSRLVLWVGDQDMATSRQPVWPLLKATSVDLAKPFPFGTDPRGRVVTMELPYTNLLVGSIPGYGKTSAIVLPMLVAGLDPYAQVWGYEFKGTGGLDPLAKVCARYASGQDDDTAEEGLLVLRELRKECQRRATIIKGLPRAVCPDNKVTPQLARRKGLGLHWLVVGFDECQELFAHPEFGKEAGDLAEKIIKLGRALGVILLLATQRPDAKSLPTGVSANVGTRYCLRVMGQVENDMILGTSAYRNGLRATMFSRKDKGVGYLVGATDEAQIVRTFYLNGPTIEAIAERARTVRQAAGTLTGHAAGQIVATPALKRDTLLDDILTVIPANEPKAWAETLVERLAELRPEAYAELTRDQLTAALKPYGITTGQVWGTDPQTGKGANRRGIDRAHVAEAVAQRNRNRDAG